MGKVSIVSRLFSYPYSRPRQSICFQVPAITQEVRGLPFFYALNDTRGLIRKTVWDYYCDLALTR